MTDSGPILFPEELLATVPPLYSTEETPAERKAAHIKVFDPCGRGTWYDYEAAPVSSTWVGDCDLAFWA